MDATLTAMRGAFSRRTRCSVRGRARPTPRPVLRPRAVAKPTETVPQHVGDKDAQEVQERERPRGMEQGLGVASAALPLYLAAASPALAFDASFFSLENIIQLALVLGFYLVVGPAFTYLYLRKRWYNRSTLETMFQYFLVFFFFPGILLASPFVNLRPNDEGRMLLECCDTVL